MGFVHILYDNHPNLLGVVHILYIISIQISWGLFIYYTISIQISCAGQYLLASTRYLGAYRMCANHSCFLFIYFQGNCGACYAFATTGALEGQHALKYGSLVSLSEQNIIDCTQLYG